MGGMGAVAEKKAKKDELENRIVELRQIPVSQVNFVEDKTHIREAITRVAEEKTTAERKEGAEEEKARMPVAPVQAQRIWRRPETELALQGEETRAKARDYDSAEEVEAEEIHIQTKAVELLEREIGERAREEAAGAGGPRGARGNAKAKPSREAERIRIRRPSSGLFQPKEGTARELLERDRAVRAIALRLALPAQSRRSIVSRLITTGGIRMEPAGNIDRIVSGMLRKGKK